MYVWFDALINYITAIGFGNEQQERAVGFEKFWPALHVMGRVREGELRAPGLAAPHGAASVVEAQVRQEHVGDVEG